jgi:PAS domain S-box-containing protein
VPGIADWLAELFEHLPWGVLVADDDAFYVAANRAACTLLGRSHSEVVGKHLSDIIAPGRQVEVDVQWRAFLRDGTQSGVFAVVVPDGTQRTFHFHAQASFVPGLHCSFLTPLPEPRAPSAPGAPGPELLTMCAWTKRVLHGGRWITIEEYLQDAHHLTVSHGISPEAFSVL